MGHPRQQNTGSYPPSYSSAPSWGPQINSSLESLLESESEVAKVKSLSRVWLFAIMDCSPPGFSMGFSRQEYWTGLPFPSPGGLPDPRIKPKSPALQADTLPSEPPGKPFLGEIIKIQHFNYSWFIFLCLDNCKESHRRPCLTYLLSNCLTCSPDENLTRSKLEGV